MTPDEWHDLIKGMLRAEMTRRGITYDQLAAKLAEIGVNEQPRACATKLRVEDSQPCFSCSA